MANAVMPLILFSIASEVTTSRKNVLDFGSEKTVLALNFVGITRTNYSTLLSAEIVFL